jgi:hypothetical protein
MPTYPYLTQVVHGAARTRPGQPCLNFDRFTGKILKTRLRAEYAKQEAPVQ